jgi:hypothetical protein
MVATKERIEFKIAPLRPGWRRGETPPPNEPPPPNPPQNGGGNRRVPVGFLIIIVAVAVSASSYNTISLSARTAVESGAVSLSTYLVFLVAIPIAAFAAYWNARQFSFSKSHGYEEYIVVLRRRSFRNYTFGMLIILCCFHAAIYFQLFEMRVIIETSAAVVTFAQLLEQMRFSYFFPQTSRDLETVLQQ